MKNFFELDDSQLINLDQIVTILSPSAENGWIICMTVGPTIEISENEMNRLKAQLDEDDE